MAAGWPASIAHTVCAAHATDMHKAKAHGPGKEGCLTLCDAETTTKAAYKHGNDRDKPGLVSSDGNAAGGINPCATVSGSAGGWTALAKCHKGGTGH